MIKRIFRDFFSHFSTKERINCSASAFAMPYGFETSVASSHQSAAVKTWPFIDLVRRIAATDEV